MLATTLVVLVAKNRTGISKMIEASTSAPAVASDRQLGAGVAGFGILFLLSPSAAEG